MRWGWEGGGCGAAASMVQEKPAQDDEETCKAGAASAASRARWDHATPSNAAWLQSIAHCIQSPTKCSKQQPGRTHRHIEAELLYHSVVQRQPQHIQQLAQVVRPASGTQLGKATGGACEGSRGRGLPRHVPALPSCWEHGSVDTARSCCCTSRSKRRSTKKRQQKANKSCLESPPDVPGARLVQEAERQAQLLVGQHALGAPLAAAAAPLLPGGGGGAAGGVTGCLPAPLLVLAAAVLGAAGGRRLAALGLGFLSGVACGGWENGGAWNEAGGKRGGGAGRMAGEQDCTRMKAGRRCRTGLPTLPALHRQRKQGEDAPASASRLRLRSSRRFTAASLQAGQGRGCGKSCEPSAHASLPTRRAPRQIFLGLRSVQGWLPLRPAGSPHALAVVQTAAAQLASRAHRRL